jgi:hypothetical protein
VLMVMGLIVPFVGPAIDHHYVDRSPAHAHVFVGEETNAHEHSLASFDHGHDSGVNGDGISLVTSSVSSGHSPLTIDGATLESQVLSYDDNLIAIYLVDSPVLDAEAIAPLDRPPRLG